MAAERAAALTEAYRILSHDERRAEYDKALAASGGGVATESAPAAERPSTSPAAQRAAPPPSAESSDPSAGRAEPPKGGQFHTERLSRDAFVRKAMVGRIQQALTAVAGDYDQAQVAGFDFACTPRKGLFSRAKGPRLLGRFVPRVDGRSVAETWSRAGQWAGSEDACVFLFGSDLAPTGELAKAINDERRKAVRTKSNVTLIPVDARTWEAHMPLDAPGIAKTLLTRLRAGA